jgi:hypothetical protein
MDYHGVRYDLAFLRSLNWLQATGATPGGNIHLSLPEMGLDGPALVESINACPPIEPDDGTGRMIVTGTMRHLASNVLNVSITGLDDPLGVTDTHPIWSETRHNFVTAGQLKVGEHLRSETGAISQVTRITPKRGPPQLTYNLEVNAQHVYQVATSGLLVHNACGIPHGYGIINKNTGEVMKFGVSRAKDGINASGLSKRAQSQLSGIAKRFGGSADDYESVLLRTFDNSSDMFKWEKETVGIWRALGHQLPANQLPKGLNPFNL